MAGVPVKFRCSRCNQLLGVSRSKVGAMVSCPKCAAELVVPEPVEAAAMGPDPASQSLLSSIASGVSQEFLALRPEDIRVEPDVLWEPPPPRASEPLAPVELPPPPIPRPEPEPLAPLIEAPRPPDLAPVVPAIQLDAPRPVAPAPRSRDVVLPRSVAAAWSLFVLMALALAFMAGLLAGHYVWQVHR